MNFTAQIINFFTGRYPLPVSSLPTRIRIFLAVVVPFIFASILLIISERCNQGSLMTFGEWLIHDPVMAVLNLTVYACLTWFCIFFTNRLDGGCQLASLFALLPVISMLKRSWLLEPLIPNDIKLTGQMFEVLCQYLYRPTVVIPALLGGLYLILSVGYAVRFAGKTRFAIGVRMAGCIISLGMLLLLSIHPRTALADSRPHLSGSSAPRLNDSYLEHGFALTFVQLAEREAITQMGYSEIAVQTALQKLPGPKPLPQPEIQPDIVVILSESLWDPTQLPDVSFSRDPLSHLHTLQKEGTSLKFLTPGFGGMTANTEFELLTGFSLSFFEEGIVPYVEPTLTRPQPSIVRFFATQGYHTLAIHNFDRSFWHRQHVYARLGFQQFDGAEVFENSAIRGDHIADAALGDRIISELKQANTPTFLMGITMQNHGPYRPDRYDNFDVQVSSSRLDTTQLANLQTYTQGVYDTDAMLGKLTDFLRQRQRPTVLLYFGDHLPQISKGFDVLKNTGLVTGEQSPADRLVLHSTPALFWSNYPLKLNFPQQTISPEMVWPSLLPALGLDHPFYRQFLSRVRRQTPGIIWSVCLDDKDSPQVEPSLEADKILADYRLLQHDLLTGQRYSLQKLFTPAEIISLAKPVTELPPRAAP